MSKSWMSIILITVAAGKVRLTSQILIVSIENIYSFYLKLILRSSFCNSFEISCCLMAFKNLLYYLLVRLWAIVYGRHFVFNNKNF